MENKMKPCDATCPKCGARDIHRVHRGGGEALRRPSSERMPQGGHIGSGDHSWMWIVLSECIHNHCRICHYEWTTDTLTTEQEVPRG